MWRPEILKISMIHDESSSKNQELLAGTYGVGGVSTPSKIGTDPAQNDGPENDKSEKIWFPTILKP